MRAQVLDVVQFLELGARPGLSFTDAGHLGVGQLQRGHLAFGDEQGFHAGVIVRDGGGESFLGSFLGGKHWPDADFAVAVGVHAHLLPAELYQRN